MKKTVISAVALSLASTHAAANGDDWATLDQQIDALASSLAFEGEGPQIDGFIIADYDSSSDIDTSEAEGEQDLGGFDTDSARIIVSGSQSGWGYMLHHDFARDELQDAYMRFDLGGNVQGQLGLFRSPVLRSGLVMENNLFFRDRTPNGAVWRQRQEGFMLSGDFDLLDWAIAIQDGTDGDTDDYLISARVELDVIGNGAGVGEGAAFATDEDNPGGSVAISFFDDGAVTDGDGFAADFHVSSSTYSFGLELISLGDGAAGLSNYTAAGGDLENDSTPFTGYGTWMFMPDEAEVGVRFSDLDNTAGGEKLEIGVNRYWASHKAKAGIFIEDYSSDDDAADVTIAGVRAVVAW